MKLSEILPLLEARVNPKDNPKLSAYEQLKQYKNNPNIFISFTEINKLGLNPLSEYDTPLGIYCYPLQVVWNTYNVDKNKSLKELPFQSRTPYIQVFEWNGKGTFLKDIYRDYNQSTLRNDIARIKELSTSGELDGILSYDTFDIDEIIDKAIRTSYDNSPASHFFNICRLLTASKSKTVTKRVDGKSYFPDIKEITPSQSARIWNTLLRKLGYAGFQDNGHAIIHENEPEQAVFLSMEYIHKLDTILNNDYETKQNIHIKPKINPNGITLVGIVEGNKLFVSPKNSENSLSWEDAVLYCQSKNYGGYTDWRLPTPQEAKIIGKSKDAVNLELGTIFDDTKYWSIANNGNGRAIEFHVDKWGDCSVNWGSDTKHNLVRMVRGGADISEYGPYNDIISGTEK